jgi:hypothetical protein
MRNVLCSTSVALLAMGCATFEVPPQKAAWAESVRQQIAAANETNYVYVAVADKEEARIVEKLAFKQGKETQQVQRNGQMAQCVFVYGPEQFFKPTWLPVGDSRK